MRGQIDFLAIMLVAAFAALSADSSAAQAAQYDILIRGGTL